MRKVVITFGIRSAIGDFGGALSGISPCDLATSVAIEAIARAGVGATSSALILNRLCGSGLQAVVTGAEQIMLGNAKMALAGSAENMSRIGQMINAARFGVKLGAVTAIDMVTGALTGPFGNEHMEATAENIATVNSIDRAGTAINDGQFNEQILPLMVKKGRQQVVFEIDEHVRANISSLDLQKLPSVFKKMALSLLVTHRV
jgi:acetyl-CoA C-acetyltransferase